MGDPAGIGPDLIVQAHGVRRSHDLPDFIAFADRAVLTARAQVLGLNVDIEPLTKADSAVPPGRLGVVDVPVGVPVVPGQANSGAAQAVIAAIEQAVTAVRLGQAKAIVTLPIAKSVLHAAGFAHPGHTEFLGFLAERDWFRPVHPVMMLAAAELRVVPVTIHVPIAAVPGLLTTSLIVETARITHAALRHDFGIAEPRIAVAGLNPHAGESGSIGHEDAEIIAPAVGQLRAAGLKVFGPLSADTLFHAAARTGYDACLAMYHDQALIPIKTLAFDRGVNVTIGLPFVRTSPDHGTAFSLAGTGKADPTSFFEALRLASTMAARRALGASQ
jgi:4-hydroxythreonine-4-phosphate dehydrogenase